jgi:ATP-binding protein involved in chromosome partitioning
MNKLPQVKHIIAVNLAIALAQQGARTGILDADIYGPSQPLMLGITTKPEVKDNKKIVPIMAHGVQSMSIGYLIAETAAMIWRGPMATGALQQMLMDTLWDDLEYLIIDLPPGTGDIQLTLAQKIPLAGVVIVTTPQDLALIDARRAVEMFRKVDVPILGVIENMSVHVCSECGHEERIFGEGGGMRFAEQYHIPLLGSVPLDMAIRAQMDSGQPTVAAAPASANAKCYQAIASALVAKLSLPDGDDSSSFPTIEIKND